MRVLIAYASKTGSAAEMAALLAQTIPNHEVTLCDVAIEHKDPSGFDYVVLGGPIRMNRMYKPMRRYLAKYDAALCALPHTLFLCCAFPDQFDHYLGVSFSRELIRTAEQCVYFGGDLTLSRHHGFDKWIARMVRNAILEGEEDGLVLPGLLPEHVRLLGDRLRKK